MLAVIGLTLLVLYLAGVAVFKILIFFEWCLRQKKIEDNSQFLITTLLLAWVWPIWIFVGYFWARDMDEIINETRRR